MGWISLREFLRRCPSCGRRFVVRLQSKTIAKDERDSEQIVHDVVVLQVIPDGITHKQISIERKTFDVTYECKNCHHEWMETINAVKKG